MNAYLVIASEYYLPEYTSGWMVHPGGDAVAVVFALTRGQARAAFLDEFSELEWTDPISIRLLDKNVAHDGELVCLEEYKEWKASVRALEKETN